MDHFEIFLLVSYLYVVLVVFFLIKEKFDVIIKILKFAIVSMLIYLPFLFISQKYL